MKKLLFFFFGGAMPLLCVRHFKNEYGIFKSYRFKAAQLFSGLESDDVATHSFYVNQVSAKVCISSITLIRFLVTNIKKLHTTLPKVGF